MLKCCLNYLLESKKTRLSFLLLRLRIARDPLYTPSLLRVGMKLSPSLLRVSMKLSDPDLLQTAEPFYIYY
jgi:hypothetical protein